MLKGSWSIRTKIVLGTGAVALTSWGLLAAFSHAVSGMLLSASSRQMFEAASISMSAELRSTYEPVERTTSLLAHSPLVDAQNEAERMRQVPVLIAILQQTPAAAAIQVGDDRGNYFIVRVMNDALSRRFDAPPGSLYQADIIDAAARTYRRWFYDDAGRVIAARQLPASDYDPRTRPWYRAAMKAPSSAVTPPYVFFFMAEVGITVGHASANRRAVVATDVALSSLSRALANLGLTPASAAVLHDAEGVVAWSGSAPPLVAQVDGTLRRRAVGELGHAGLSAVASGQVPPGWLFHRAKLGLGDEAGSELIVAVPEEELLADIRRMRTQVLLVSFVVLGLLVPLTWVLANRISTPLRELHQAIGRVRAGDHLDFWLPDIRSRDEVGDLNLALRTLRESLKGSAQQLAAATAARERLESELGIARRIQMGFVPGGGRYAKDFAHASLFASLIPARAVGGDLYEVISLPGGRIFVAVGDVSDKGIPAALLMSRVVTLAKLLVPGTADLGELLRTLNRQLADGNAECMFVTLFCVILDPASGEARCACAGHNPPLAVRHRTVSELTVASGPPLGLFEGAAYSESTIRLEPGERLLMYSDGITEAFDAQQRQFGVERLVATAGRIGLSGTVEQLGSAVLADVAAFAGSTPQSDDITLLVLARGAAAPPPLALRLIGQEARIGNATGALAAFAERAGLPDGLRADLLTVLDELLANALGHGADDPARLEVEIGLSIEDGAVVLRFADNGASFDPLSAPPPPFDAPLIERPPGGLGLYLIRQLTDSQHYARQDGRNVLLLRRALTA